MKSFIMITGISLLLIFIIIGIHYFNRDIFIKGINKINMQPKNEDIKTIKETPTSNYTVYGEIPENNYGLYIDLNNATEKEMEFYSQFDFFWEVFCKGHNGKGYAIQTEKNGKEKCSICGKYIYKKKGDL